MNFWKNYPKILISTQKISQNNNNNSSIKSMKCKWKDATKSGNLLKHVVHKYCSKSTVITVQGAHSLLNNRSTSSNWSINLYKTKPLSNLWMNIKTLLSNQVHCLIKLKIKYDKKLVESTYLKIKQYSLIFPKI